jgi:hypothetical protein
MAKISRLSIRELLNLNVLWFALNFQYAALLPNVIPTQILLFVGSSGGHTVCTGTQVGMRKLTC